MAQPPDDNPRPHRDGEPPFVQGELAALSEREQTVLRMRYGISGDGKRYTLEEVGKAIGGVTKERVRRIQNEALARMRRRRDEQSATRQRGSDGHGPAI